MATVRTHLRPTLRVLALTCMIAALAACAQPGLNAAGGGPDTTVASSGTRDSGPAASPTAAGQATGQSVTGCQSTQLHLAVVPGDNPSGHIGLVLVFTNTSARPCTLKGFPGVSFLTAGGAQINDPAQWSTAMGSPSTVTLAAGGLAHADLLLVNTDNYAGSPDCQPTTSARIRVYPPNNTVALFVASAQKICDVSGTGVPVVYPVRAGASDS
jgi:uncharacterized protein DUF4232